MDNRKFASGASATPPSPPASPSVGFPTSGNPGTGTPATSPGDYWYHQVGEEMRSVITAAGLTPDNTNLGQLAQAIQQLIAAGGVKIPVRVATTANVASLAGGAPNTLDGVALAANDRILVKDQATGSQNGIYVVTTLGTGGNGTWTRATDADGVGELFGGMLVVVQEGGAYADTLWELVTDGLISIGTSSLTFSRKDASSSATVQGVFKNLQGSATGTNATVSISGDEIVVEDSSNNYKTLRNVALSINSAASGANGLDTGTLAASTWYALWVIWNGTTTAGLISTSSTAPTMPSGYTHKARVGWIRTDGTANKYPLAFVQKGRRVQYLVAAGSNVAALPTMASGVVGNPATPTWSAVSVSSFVPPTAAEIVISVFAQGTAAVAPNNNYGATSSSTNPPPWQWVPPSTQSKSEVVGMVLESSNIYAATSEAAARVNCFGWVDNL